MWSDLIGVAPSDQSRDNFCLFVFNPGTLFGLLVRVLTMGGLSWPANVYGTESGGRNAAEDGLSNSDATLPHFSRERHLASAFDAVMAFGLL